MLAKTWGKLGPSPIAVGFVNGIAALLVLAFSCSFLATWTLGIIEV